MPYAAPRPCTHPGCGRLVHDGSGRCSKHPKSAWQKPADAAKRITGRRLQRMRAELFAREPLCRLCAARGDVVLATERDHIVPLEEGGKDEDANVQPLCADCHDAKSKAERARGRARGGASGVAILPSWLPGALIPVTVVCGPPGSGKSYYVAQHAAPVDLVIDVDVIAAEMTGKELYMATYDERMEALRKRNQLLAEIGKSSKWPRAWLIATAGTPHQRDFWRDRYGSLVVMNTSKSECIERICLDSRRTEQARIRAIKAVEDWC